MSEELNEKRMATDIVIACLQTARDNREAINLSNPDKVADFFDIIYQRIKST